MPEFVNPNSYTVHLTGPDGKQVQVKSRQKMVLDEFFDRYVARGFIKRAAHHQAPQQPPTQRPPKVQAKLQLTAKKQRPSPALQRKSADLAREARKKKQVINRAQKISRQSLRRQGKTPVTRRDQQGKKLIVGKRLAVDAIQLLQENLKKNNFPISNNIGVGIMSYNRKQCLKRLVDSVIKFTDLRSTKIFISDDGSTNKETVDYLESISKNPNIIVIRNDTNLGVAGNNNRLIRCLSRFGYGLILNDDIEIVQPEWEYFYVEAMRKTGIHHFQYREPGVYGAEKGELVNKGEFHIRKVMDRPQGAVLAFTRDMLVKCGYFDESYGKYGMEHVDWSMKPFEFGLQEQGFFDVEGSDDYFKLHGDKSSIDGDRSTHLKEARSIFANRAVRNRVGPTESSRVPEISYIIPFRNTDREDSIATVISNIRGQSFPVVHIVIVEQDVKTRIDLEKFRPVIYHLADEHANRLFNKSMAFNVGVSKAPSDKLILHDADMLVLGNYTSSISDVLDRYESCHLGGTVIYTSEEAMAKINRSKIVDTDASCDRVVGYYEGGSLACTKQAYWKVGGFNEDYWGYGCEDCDFYARLSSGSRWKEDRKFDLLHLWHGRVDGWNNHHKENKKLETELCKLPMDRRISMQREQVKRLGYGELLG